MAHQLFTGDGFIDDADASQPRITINIDGGLQLTEAERLLRDEMFTPFVDDLVTAIRAFYDVRRMIGPPKRRSDATLAAAITETEASLK